MQKGIRKHRKTAVTVLACVLGICGLLYAGEASATARVLEVNYTVNATDAYSYASSTTATCSGQPTATNELSCTLSQTPTENNGDGTFDITVAQSSGTVTMNGGTPLSITGDTQYTTAYSGTGRQGAALNAKELFSQNEYITDNYDAGTSVDVTGKFPTTAVDVNDTWTYVRSVTPYGQAARDVTATATLMEWTTLNGYNVAKIRYTWSEPYRACNLSRTNEYMDGTMSCTTYIWLAYAEKKIVKVSNTASGVLTSDVADPGTDYDWNFSSSLSQTLN